MNYHELACIFPLMTEDELQHLADDILENGLQAPIELFEGKILDGRNRYEACLLANWQPDFVEWVGDDPLAYVLSANLHRRHLTESQRAMIAARYISVESIKTESKAGANLPPKGKKSDAVGEALNVSGRSVRSAKKVLDKATPAVQQAVDSGKLPVSTAAKVADMPKRDQNQIAKAASPAKAANGKVKTPKETDWKHKRDVAKKTAEALLRAVDDLAAVRKSGNPRRYQACIEYTKTVLVELGEWK
jgi:ParB-like chromosome segregation protein Spo0J